MAPLYLVTPTKPIKGKVRRELKAENKDESTEGKWNFSEAEVEFMF